MRDIRTELMAFWFQDIDPKQWFQSNEFFDTQVTDRFLNPYKLAAQGLCDGWMNDAEGSVALCILLNHIPKALFRGKGAAYQSDEKALFVARQAIAKRYDEVITFNKRRFLYQPFLHSEKLRDQIQSVALFEKIQDFDPVSYNHAKRRMKIIQDFGRFPDRNEVLGRQNTDEENQYLAISG